MHDNGLSADQFGHFVTKNPFIFEQQLEDLQVRINYLEAKKFISSDITRIITSNPSWLNFRYKFPFLFISHLQDLYKKRLFIG